MSVQEREREMRKIYVSHPSEKKADSKAKEAQCRNYWRKRTRILRIAEVIFFFNTFQFYQKKSENIKYISNE